MLLPKDIRFFKGKGDKKYTAIIPPNKMFPRGKTVHFGHKDYEHYKDTVPKSFGGGLWTHKNHLDKERRKNYRRRHRVQKCKNGEYCYKIRYSPSWFSYYFLW